MKKIYLAVIILLSVIITALFPADLFLFSVPEWVIFALLAALTAAAVMLFVRGRAKTPVKVLSAALTVIVIAASLTGIYIDPYYNNTFLYVVDDGYTKPYDTVISPADACADLDYAMKYLRKVHPALMDGFTPELSDRYAQVKAEISGSGGMTVNRLTAEIETVFTLLGDAHTSVYARFGEPLYLKHYHGIKTGGWSITGINGLTIKELLDRSTALYSFEAESWELEQLKGALPSVQGLDYLGFDVSQGITYMLENDEGDQRSETYYPEDFVTYAEYVTYNGLGNADNADEPFVSFTIDDDRSLAVLTLTECIFNSKYVNCVRDMFTQVKQRGIKNVAVDLRDNGGGNDAVASELIRHLDTDSIRIMTYSQRLGFLNVYSGEDTVTIDRYSDLTFTGNLYLLTSAGSFSSAMGFAQLIKDNSLGTLIGEPPGNDPNGYGEITTFKLPNSGIKLSISTKHFIRADRECTDKYVMPDIACDAENASDVLYSVIAE